MQEIREAEHWLKSAQKLMKVTEEGREKYTVVVAQCIHSIIRANDALSTRFLNRHALRHDQAPKLFLELIQSNKIPSEYAPLRSIVTDAVQLKSHVDYRGKEMSKKEAIEWLRNAEKFLKRAKGVLEG